MNNILYEEVPGEKIAKVKNRCYDNIYEIKIIKEHNMLPFEKGMRVDVNLDRLSRKGFFIGGSGVYEKRTRKICSECKEEAFYNQKTDSYECVICNE